MIGAGTFAYRRRLPHLVKAGKTLFVTFCTRDRRELTSQERTLVLNCCVHDHLATMFLHCVVVMPDHVHLLFRPLRDNNGWAFPLVDIMQCMKGATAHRVNKLLQRSGPVWQEESFDHVLRSHESLKEKAEYIRQNPVRRGLVKRPEDYRWLWISPELKV